MLASHFSAVMQLLEEAEGEILTFYDFPAEQRRQIYQPAGTAQTEGSSAAARWSASSQIAWRYCGCSARWWPSRMMSG
jgi:hypothetical protein